MISKDKEYAELPRAPPWTEMEAVAKWVGRVLEAVWSEEEREHAELYNGQYAIPGIPISGVHAAMEREAVARAELGDFEPLADLLHPEHLLNRHPVGGPIREVLAPATWILIAQRLTGQLKARRGRRPLPVERRRASFPIHNAADLVQQVERILRTSYGRQSGKEIRDRALYVVERRTGVTVEKLENYLKRPKRDRRRTRP